MKLEISWLDRGQKFHSPARNYEWNLERTSNSSQSTPTSTSVLWEELLEGKGEKSEGETSIFWVLTVESCCQYMGHSYETDWVNIILEVI